MHKVLIVGGGPSGLILAEYLSRHKEFEVHIFDQKKALGRKFLVAGDGGLNLSNNQPIERFVSWYDHSVIQNLVRSFTAEDLAFWFKDLGIETYYGSSGKLFPLEDIKPIQVLNAILNRIKQQGVHIHTETKVIGWKDKFITCEHRGEVRDFAFDTLCFAMGGASWQTTGSDGKWISFIEEKVKCVPFQSSNAGVNIKNGFPESYRGSFLKNVHVTVNDQTLLGEVRFTDYGLEGSPIYALNAQIRNGGNLTIDLKPQFTEEELLKQIHSWKGNTTEFLKKMKLGFGLNLLRDRLSKADYTDKEKLVKAIKAFPFEMEGLRPLEEAISSVGGVAMDEVNDLLEAVRYPNVFFLGEMLDWDTRTGGYLLQACFSSGVKVAQTIISRCEVGIHVL